MIEPTRFMPIESPCLAWQVTEANMDELAKQLGGSTDVNRHGKVRYLRHPRVRGRVAIAGEWVIQKESNKRLFFASDDWFKAHFKKES